VTACLKPKDQDVEEEGIDELSGWVTNTQSQHLISNDYELSTILHVPRLLLAVLYSWQRINKVLSLDASRSSAPELSYSAVGVSLWVLVYANNVYPDLHDWSA
jgi:hypothetical protein